MLSKDCTAPGTQDEDDDDAHLVTWSSNSQGDHFFNATQNYFHLCC